MHTTLILGSIFIALVSACVVTANETEDEKIKGMVPLKPCKEWCEDHCHQECELRGFGGEGIKHECKSDSQCNCTCPANKADCTDEWCLQFCNKHANGRKFDTPTCKDKHTCQCRFKMEEAGMGDSKKLNLPKN